MKKKVFQTFPCQPIPVFFFLMVTGASVSGCGIGIDSAGDFLPTGDLNVKFGSERFQLYCTLNISHKFYSELGLRSDSLFIEQRSPATKAQSNHLYQNKNVNSEIDEFQTNILNSEIVNETTIVAWYDPSVVTSDLLGCGLKKENESPSGSYAICHKHINVGYPPLMPENFKCVSQNWENLKCTWDEPYNPVKTTYTLLYTIRSAGYFKRVPCPPSTHEQDFGESLQGRAIVQRGNCYLDHQTKPLYRNVKKQFKFYMKMTNGLKSPNGTYPDYEIQYPIINHYKIVRPNKPVSVTMAPLGSTSIKVRFRIPHELDHFPPGLNYSIRYRSEFDEEDKWVSKPSGHLPNRDLCYHRDCETENGEDHVFLENLLPYAEYSVQIKLLSAVADAADDNMWSDIAKQRNRTLSSVPSNPPQTIMGGFEMLDITPTERKVIVYWKQIKPSERNGPRFQYEALSQKDGLIGGPEYAADQITRSYASFKRISQSAAYKITTRSVNSEGNSLMNSTMTIPSNKNNQLLSLSPRAATKILYSETLVEVSWLAPVYDSEITKYTIFWCSDRLGRERPYHCIGNLSWKEVTAEHRSTNITLPSKNIYQFAVSAHAKDNVSSGMAWTSCTILHNKVVERLKPVKIDKVEPTSMHISWDLDCSDRVGVVTGYEISYCAISSANASSPCLINSKGHNNMLHVETEPDKHEIWLTNLEPWTYYKASVLVRTRGGSGQLSIFSIARTKPTMPEESVRQLQGYLVGRSSVNILWKAPLKPNGEIDKYEIKYSSANSNGRQSSIVRQTVGPNGRAIQIDSLKFYSEYIFEVRPCVKLNDVVGTSICGKTWSAIRITTNIGESSQMQPPKITFVNQSEVNVAWSANEFDHGGPVTGYEINLVSQELQRSHKVTYKLPNDTQLEMSTNIMLDQIIDEMDWMPDCGNMSTKTNLYNFSIRAVTYDKHNHKSYYSPWSSEEVVPAYCYHSPPVGLIISLCIFASVIVVLTFLCLYKCIQWISDKLKLMKDVENVIPGELHIPTRVEGDNKWRSNGWTEMQTLPEESISNVKFNSPSKVVGMRSFSPSKMANNQSTNFKDPMAENLLNDNLEDSQKKEAVKRNTGGSDTTSGCESGETESLEKDPSVENENYDMSGINPHNADANETSRLGERMPIGTAESSHFIQPNTRSGAPSPSLKNKQLPRPPRVLETNFNRAYVKSPEKQQPAYRGSSPIEDNLTRFSDSTGTQLTPLNSPRFVNMDPSINVNYLPSTGYTKAIQANATQNHMSNQRIVAGSPIKSTFNDLSAINSEARSNIIPTGYVITGNSSSHPIPTAIPQLDNCNSLSSSTSGVSSNTPSASSHNNHNRNPSNSYVAFAAVCNDDIITANNISPTSGIRRINNLPNSHNIRETYRSLVSEPQGIAKVPNPSTMAKGYISVAQANCQELVRHPNLTHSHELGYSRVAMLDGDSGPSSLSASHMDDTLTVSKNLSNPSTKKLDPSRDFAVSRNLRQNALVMQEDPNYERSTGGWQNESQEQSFPCKYSKQSEEQMGTATSYADLPPLVISPNNLVHAEQRNLTSAANLRNYNGHNATINSSYKGPLNVVATLDGDRQSTMV